LKMVKAFANFLMWAAISVACVAGVVGAVVVSIGPWIYHIVWCIQKADESGSAIALLIVGFMIPPIGWLHGVSAWFGYYWI